MALAAPAGAVNPQDAVGGAGSKWFSGDGYAMWGENCSVIGSSYSEVMVQSVAEYGGTNGVPKVGDGYWVEILLSIPGNPCGPGSSSVATDLQLPTGTEPDPSRQIRCFGRPRNSDFGELTGGSWSFLGYSGQWCPAHPTPTASYTHAWSVGFRPLANGTMFDMFVPVKSTQELHGAGDSPVERFTWYMHATGTYEQTAPTSVFANVFSSGPPQIYFARQPAAVPGYNASYGNCPSTTIPCHGTVELWANLYTAGKDGTLCWELYDPPSSNTPAQTCSLDSASGFPLAISGANESYAFSGNGPNGGYMPPLQLSDGDPFRIRWTFTYDGGLHETFNDVTWTALPGPDDDGDGVPNASDQCKTVKGQPPSGCPPSVKPDPDKDGVYGGDDKCPSIPGKGQLNGCPPLKGAIKLSPLKVKLGKLLAGVKIPVTCNLNSHVAMSLKITRATAGGLGIHLASGKQSVIVAAGGGPCTRSDGGKPVLKAKSTYAPKLRKANKSFQGTLITKFTRSGSKPYVLKPTLRVAK